MLISELNVKLQNILAKPENIGLQLTFAHDLYAKKGKGRVRVRNNFTFNFFSALADIINPIMQTAGTAKLTFELLVAEYGLPDFITVKHFYNWRAKLKALEKEKAQALAVASAMPVAQMQKPIVSIDNSHNQQPIINVNPRPVQPAKPVINTASIVQAPFVNRNNTRPQAQFDPEQAAKLVPWNKSCLIRDEAKAQGVWPQVAGNCEFYMMPGEITNYKEVCEYWAHFDPPNGLPIPRVLRPLKPDDPLYPYLDKQVRNGDAKYGLDYSFLVDENGFVYDPGMVSSRTFGVPVPMPTYCDYKHNAPFYHNTSMPYGNYCNAQGLLRDLTDYTLVKSLLTNTVSFKLRMLNSNPLDRFVNVSAGVYPTPVDPNTRRRF